MRRILGSLLLITSIGCEATFVDLRPTEGAEAQPPPTGARGRPGEPVGTTGTTPPAATSNDQVIAQGSFEGRAGHAGRGKVSLVAHEDGSRSLRFDDDFFTGGVPGPVVYLSERPVFGQGDAPIEDLEVAPLRTTRGAQSYGLPDDVPRYMWVWIWCKPFGVEIARAKLEVVSG